MPEAFESLVHLTELPASPQLEQRLRQRWQTPLRYPALAAAVLLVAAQVVGKTPMMKAAATAPAARPGEPDVITFPTNPTTALTLNSQPSASQAAAFSGSSIVIQIQLEAGQSVTAAYLVLPGGTEVAGSLTTAGAGRVSASFPQTSGHWQAVFVINGQAWLLKIPS